jgi:hypothetical protein
LNEEEWEIMRRHPEDGFHIVSQLPGMDLAAQVTRADWQAKPSRWARACSPSSTRWTL